MKEAGPKNDLCRLVIMAWPFLHRSRVTDFVIDEEVTSKRPLPSPQVVEKWPGVFMGHLEYPNTEDVLQSDVPSGIFQRIASGLWVFNICNHIQ